MTASATVGVLGPGAVGGVLAVGLVRSGVRVICIARPDTAALIASEGLTLKHGPEDETVRPEATTALREPVDLLLVTVKAPALDDALGRIEAPVETVVPLLNGIEHMDTIRRRIPDARVVGATIGWIEAWLDRPGRDRAEHAANADDRRLRRRRGDGRAAPPVRCRRSRGRE